MLRGSLLFKIRMRIESTAMVQFYTAFIAVLNTPFLQFLLLYPVIGIGVHLNLANHDP